MIDVAAQGKELTITQSETGVIVGGKPERKVTILNDDNCTHKDIVLSCPGFQTVKKVDPSILLPQGGKCLVNGGNPIYAHTSLSFTYAWTTPTSFAPNESTIACS